MATKETRYGSELPRVWTKPLRELTPETSRGFEVIAFATILGVVLLPWQRWLLIHALELLPDGRFRFRTVLLLVARQNGKSLVMQVLSMWHLFVNASKLVIGTAQNLDVAEEQWQAVVDMAQEDEFLAERIKHVDRAAGKRALRLVTGERYKVAAASRKGGRGLSGDLVLMDELREHTNWEAWGAVSKTTLARPRAQVWAASNAGDIASVVLAFLRRQGHAALGNPDGLEDLEAAPAIPEEFMLGEEDDVVAEALASLGIFEWSAPPGCSKWDRDGWAWANPSMNHDMGDPTKMLTERAIAAAVATEPERIVRTEVLCQWLETTVDGPFPAGQWEAAQDPTSRRGEGERYCYGIDMSHDRSTVHISVCTRRPDGLVHVEVVASRSGTAWIKPWLEERKGNTELTAVALQSNGAPVSSLLIELETIEGLTVQPWYGAELGKAYGLVWDLVRGFDPADDGEDPDAAPRAMDPEAVYPPQLRHRNQPVLNLAAQMAATKPAGDGILIDRAKSPVDAAPLVSVMAAVWCYFARPPEVKKRSKYEDEDAFA